MAIGFQTGNAATSNASVTSLTNATQTFIANGRIVVGVVLSDSTKSVSSVTNSGTAGTWSSISSYNVPSGPRIEIWECTNITAGSKTITVNLSGSCSVAFAVEQYTGDVGTVTGSPTQTASSFDPRGQQANTFQSDLEVFVVGFLGSSSDTMTADTGTKRQSAVGTDGTAVALLDGGGGNIANTGVCGVVLNNSRTWGTLGRSLKGSTTAVATIAGDTEAINQDAIFIGSFPATVAGGLSIVSGTVPGAPIWSNFTFPPGVVGVSYSEQWDLTPAFSPTTYTVHSGSLPPGLSLTSISGDLGSISGTPTTAGTYTFTLRATNILGTADKGFSIVVVLAASGGAFTFLN